MDILRDPAKSNQESLESPFFRVKVSPAKRRQLALGRGMVCHLETELRKAGRTVGVNCNIFSTDLGLLLVFT